VAEVVVALVVVVETVVGFVVVAQVVEDSVDVVVGQGVVG
jgi:hypothetical protein